MDHLALLGREEAERARQLEERAVRRETERLFVVRGRDERRALGYDRQARGRRLVDVRVEEHGVVLAAVVVQEVEEPGAVRTLRGEPGLLVVERVWLGEDVLLELLEVRAASRRHGEAPDLEAVDHLFARRVVVRPGPVIQGGRGRDLDGVPQREPDRRRARMTLGAAHDVEAVALDDDEQPQDFLPTPAM